MKTAYCTNCQSTVKVYHDFGNNYIDVYYCSECESLQHNKL